MSARWWQRLIGRASTEVRPAPDPVTRPAAHVPSAPPVRHREDRAAPGLSQPARIYAEWLDQRFRDLGIQHFTGHEVAAFCDRVDPDTGARNAVPPRADWPLILPGLRVLDRLRRDLGSPIVLQSAYRAEAYNAAVEGKPSSLHLRNCALDFAARDGTPADWARRLQQYRRDGLFSGGIGVYPRRGFVHVDTRGTVADWTG